MQINDELKIVVPIRSDAKGNIIIYGYHTPISRAVFEANYQILASTKAEISKRGNYYRLNNGPTVAALVLRDEAKKYSIENGTFNPETGEGNDAAAVALIAELKRSTIVIAPTENGYEQLPIIAAINKGIIDAEEWQEAESALVFFTCLYSLARKVDKPDMLKAVADILKGLSTSLPPMGLIDSLVKLTKAEATEEKAELSENPLPM